MKRFLPILILTFFISGFNAHSQDRVTCPKAKFKGIQMKTNKPLALYYTEHDHKAIKGPEAKNNFSETDECEKETINVFRKANLKGPKAKNTRPEDSDYWIKKDNQ